MTQLQILPAAEEELGAAAAWYEAQRHGLGAEFLGEFEEATERLQTYPTAWRRIARDFRSCPLRRFPYSIIYATESPEMILIVAVMHLHRKPGYWKERT